MPVNPVVDVSTQLTDVTGSVIGGAVTSVTGIAPIASSGGATPQISLATPLAVGFGGTSVATFGGSPGYVKTPGGTGALTVQTTPIPVADGGTGATSIPANTAVVFAAAGALAGDITKLTWDGNNMGIQGAAGGATAPLDVSPLAGLNFKAINIRQGSANSGALTFSDPTGVTQKGKIESDATTEMGLYSPVGGALSFYTNASQKRMDIIDNGGVRVQGNLTLPNTSLVLANGLNSNIPLPVGTYFRVTGPGGAFSIGGFTPAVDGQKLYLYSAVAQTLTVVNEDASSTATNRIKTLTGANVTLTASSPSMVEFIYDGGDQRWILSDIGTTAGYIRADGTVPLTANWNAGNFVITSRNSTGWYNVKAYGATGDGVTNDTTSVSNAISAAVAGLAGTVYFPPGTYVLNASAITIAAEGIKLQGDSTGGTAIKAAAGVAGPIFKFSNGASTVNNCGVYDMRFTSADTATQKTMVQVLDCVNFSAARVKSADNEWKGATSIGFDIRGRQEIRLRDLDIYADQPISIDVNPNFASLSFDHSSIESSELVVTSALINPVIKIADGLALTNSRFDNLALVRGGGGIYFSNTTMATASQNIVIENIRCEQTALTTAYGIDLESTNGAIQNVAVNVAQIDPNGRGIKLRKVNYSYFNGVIYGGTGEFWNADNTCSGLTLSNSFRQSGSTVTDSSVKPVYYNYTTGANPATSGFGSLTASANLLNIGTTGQTVFDAGGNLGFNLSGAAPSESIDVNGKLRFDGTAGVMYAKPSSPAATNMDFVATSSGSAGYNSNGAAIRMTDDGSSNGTIKFSTNLSGTGSNERAKIDNTGRVYVNLGTATSGAAQVGGTVFTQTADSTTTANTLSTLFGTGVGSLTLPAATMIAGRTIRIRAGGYVSTADGGAGTKTVNIYLGGTNIATAASGATITTIINNGWTFDGTITCRTAGVSGTCTAGGQWLTQIGAASPVGVMTTATGASTINTTGTLAIDVQFNNGNATGAIRTTYATVEILN